MTEREWLACSDPHEMLQFLRHRGDLSERRWRLFSVACCRRIWHLMTDERSRKAVEAAERYADRAATFEELDFAFEKAFETAAEWAALADQKIRGPEPLGYAAFAASDAAHPDESADGVASCAAEASNSTFVSAAQSTLLRDLFGNPFRPVAFETAWRTTTAGKLAEAAYEERTMPAGLLEADRLAVLSDALEEAGCTTPILDHLRSPGARVRGCWALDLVLGRR